MAALLIEFAAKLHRHGVDGRLPGRHGYRSGSSAPGHAAPAWPAWAPPGTRAVAAQLPDGHGPGARQYPGAAWRLRRLRTPSKSDRSGVHPERARSRHTFSFVTRSSEDKQYRPQRTILQVAVAPIPTWAAAVAIERQATALGLVLSCC